MARACSQCDGEGHKGGTFVITGGLKDPVWKPKVCTRCGGAKVEPDEITFGHTESPDIKYFATP